LIEQGPSGERRFHHDAELFGGGRDRAGGLWRRCHRHGLGLADAPWPLAAALLPPLTPLGALPPLDDPLGPHANCRTDRQHKCQQQRFVDQGQYLTRHGRHDKLALVIIG